VSVLAQLGTDADLRKHTALPLRLFLAMRSLGRHNAMMGTDASQSAHPTGAQLGAQGATCVVAQLFKIAKAAS
jgi:hypothetical protein